MTTGFQKYASQIPISALNNIFFISHLFILIYLFIYLLPDPSYRYNLDLWAHLGVGRHKYICTNKIFQKITDKFFFDDCGLDTNRTDKTET